MTDKLLLDLFANLARRPDIYRKLRAAIEADFGSTQDMTFSKIKDCTYLQYCLNETLRLCPSVPVNGELEVHMPFALIYIKIVAVPLHSTQPPNSWS